MVYFIMNACLKIFDFLAPYTIRRAHNPCAFAIFQQGNFQNTSLCHSDEGGISFVDQILHFTSLRCIQNDSRISNLYDFHNFLLPASGFKMPACHSDEGGIL
ncbi:hypothetical protein [Chryseobacterium soli]|uniref:hypothetical protein n=1 Tax=Chryseobacterium soli TaxID=445961 RepID=UPI001040DC7F|nr:hypothetical protein [Chryseobacterium soli]